MYKVQTNQEVEKWMVYMDMLQLEVIIDQPIIDSFEALLMILS